MNVNSQPAPSPTGVTWSSFKAEEKEADFLSLRLLNKRMRIRISPLPLDSSIPQGNGSFLVVSHLKGWFIAITKCTSGENQLTLSTLDELRMAIQSSTAEGEANLEPRRILRIPRAFPTHLALSANDERLVVGHADGCVTIYDTFSLFVDGENPVDPLQTLLPSSPCPLRRIVGNPGELSDLVAIQRDAEAGSGHLSIEVLDVRSGQAVASWRCGETPETTPTAVSWSPKGKQIALGYMNGDIITYSPSDSKNPKQHIPKPPQVGNVTIISIIWLSNQAFYGIYTPFGDTSPEVTQKHVLTVYDAKSNTGTQTEFETPYYPSPALRPPGAFPVVIRNWRPAKYLIFISDSTSGDVGLIGCLSEEKTGKETWCNLSLEETSTPSLPLDKDDSDTFPLALELGITSATKAGESGSLPPVLFLYASDGTLQAWSISNSDGGQYISPIVAQSLTVASSGSDSGAEISMSTDKPTSLVPNQSSAITPSFGSTGFGNATAPSAFGQATSVGFGSSMNPNDSTNPSKAVFGQTSAPTFGALAFGQQTTLGQSSTNRPFGQTNTSESQSLAPSAKPVVASGFGAFANQGPPKFGSTGFGFGASPSLDPGPVDSSKTMSTPVDSASPEADMPDAIDEKTGSVFGSLSLGSTSDASDNKIAANSMFGSFTKPVEPKQTSLSTERGAFGGVPQQQPASFGAFGNAQGSSFIKPATGFGAFSGVNKPMDTPSADLRQVNNDTPKPSPAFGSSGFSMATNSSSAFGKPAFGQSSFGSFGKSTFGSTSTPPSTTVATSGGFSAFAGSSKGFSAFAQGSGSFSQTMSMKANETKNGDDFTISNNSSANATADTSRDSAVPAPMPQTTSSPFGTPSAPSLAAAPTTRMKTPESSPEGSPTIRERPQLDEADSPSRGPSSNQISAASGEERNDQKATPEPPSPSLKPSVPTAVTGAFGNLTTTPSFFKPAEGFGAFGTSAKVSSSSPFANPKPINTNAFSSPISAFGSSRTNSAFSPGTPAKSSNAAPAFGSTSTLGSTPTFGKSSLGSHLSTTPTTTPAKTPMSAFSSYSTGGGFSAFAGSGKSSFGEPSKIGSLGENQNSQASIDDVARTASEDKSNGPKELKLQSPFTNTSKPDEIDHDDLPPTPSSHGTFDDDAVDGKGEEDDHDDAGSFLSEDFSDGIQEGEGGADDDKSDCGQAEDRTEQTALEANSTSATLPTRDNTPKATSPENNNGRDHPPSGTPAVFGQPFISSKSTMSSNIDNTSPPSDTHPSISSPFPKTTNQTTQSTTPPDSPQKEESSSLFAPKPLVPSLSSATSLGLGRPSSQPQRSSPLANAALKPRPASPKRPFGQVAGNSSKVVTETSPPLTFTPPNGQTTRTPPIPASSSTKGSQISPFSFSPAATPPSFNLSATSSAIPTPKGVNTSSTTLPLNRPLFGGPSSNASSPTGIASSKPAPQPSIELFESEMQSGCVQLCAMVQKELFDLSKFAQDAISIRARLSRSASSSHSKADFGDKSKWAMGDIDVFARLLKSCEKDIMIWYSFKAEIVPILKEVESNLLKAETRKEEITRFSKAKADPEFARMLKSRTLGPDANETRDQLRRQIRLVNDRVEQLEAHLKACKKKTEEHRKGKTSMKPPSLDTINRTYRNIDVAIEMQLQQIAELNDRVSKLNLKTLQSRGTSHLVSANGHGSGLNADTGVPPSSGRFRTEVTSSIAASTAAALNAERSAMRLKLALARNRTTPLINRRAVDLPSGRVPNLAQKSIVQDEPFSPCAFSPNSSPSSAETSPTNQRQIYGRTTRHSVHAKAPQLGRTHQKVPSDIANFSFGPLPGAKPMECLPSDVRPEATRNLVP